MRDGNGAECSEDPDEHAYGEDLAAPAVDTARPDPPEPSADRCPPSMSKVRPASSAALMLSRARVFGALFGDTSERSRFGRFRILERLGAGAMGVVYAARDPELDRDVALKVIDVPARGREAALAEAKRLARLSHPNVVPIHGVGIEGDHMYFVMELVRGKTLRHWVEDRAVREILDVYQQAGAALATAHAAGLVHRDFKPDNAVVGTDGRVRVIDFGLACEIDDPASERDRRPAGTPHYMAPEILAGDAVTPAADQYSFCVALSDALATVTRGPALARITAILERGRAADPRARFASMPELLRLLARDPARTRRRIGAVGTLSAMIGAIAFFVGQRTSPSVDLREACEAGPGLLAMAWQPGARSAQLTGIAAMGSYGKELERLLRDDLSSYAQRWTAEYRAACRSRIGQEQSAIVLYHRELCVGRAKDAYARLGELAAAAQPTTLAGFANAARSLPEPAQCSDEQALASAVALPSPAIAQRVDELHTQLTRARVDLDAGRYVEARDAARAAVATAQRTLDYAPLVAEALLLEGHAEMRFPTSEDAGRTASATLEQATAVALGAYADSIAVEAWARRAWLRGTRHDPARALDGLELIDQIARRTPTATFARALLYNNVGTVLLARNQRGDARTQFELARSEASHLKDVPLELLVIQANLGVATDDRAESDQLFAETVAAQTRLLGSQHPDTLGTRLQRAMIATADLSRAREALVPVCDGYDLYPVLLAKRAQCASELGRLHWELGDTRAAIAAMERAHRADPVREPAALPYASLWRGDAATAARQFRDLLAKRPPRPDEVWWDRRSRAVLYLGLGQAQRESGQLSAARGSLQAAVESFAPVAKEHPSVFNERWLGRARVDLALTRIALGEPAQTIAPIAAAASAWLREVNSPSRELEELEQLREGIR